MSTFDPQQPKPLPDEPRRADDSPLPPPAPHSLARPSTPPTPAPTSLPTPASPRPPQAVSAPPAAPVRGTPRRATVRVRHIAYGPLAQFGCLLGAVGWVIPGLLLGLGVSSLVGAARRWLDGIQDFNLSLLGREIARVNLVQALGLTMAQGRLQALDAAGPLTILGVTFSVALVGGLLAMLIILLLGVVYNALAATTGGIELDLDERVG